jgi:hypothetical protein
MLLRFSENARDDVKEMMQEPRFIFLSSEDRPFVVQFDNAMCELGYDHGDEIGRGYCWGKYVLIYRRSGAKSRYKRESTSAKAGRFSGYS